MNPSVASVGDGELVAAPEFRPSGQAFFAEEIPSGRRMERPRSERDGTPHDLGGLLERRARNRQGREGCACCNRFGHNKLRPSQHDRRKSGKTTAIHLRHLTKIDNPGAFSARRNCEGVSAPSEMRSSSISPS